MNILIVGEYSGFSKNLKTGFLKLGHHAIVISAGDGRKKINHDEDDITFSFEKTYYVFKKPLPFIKPINALIKNYLLNKKIKKINHSFDLVLIINCEFLIQKRFANVGVSYDLLKKKLKKSGKIILSACSYDPAFYKYVHELKYSPFISNNADITNKYIEKNHEKLFFKTLKSVDKIAPTDYIYHYNILRYLKDNKINTQVSAPIFLPFNLPELKENKKAGKKIKILHGLLSGKNRVLIKGSNHILEAMNSIKEKYPNEVELLLPRGLPYNEYINVLKDADIVIDQCYSYGLGVNAVMAMSYGKVVFGGNEKETRELFDIDYIPVINIIPDPGQIAKELEKLILNPDRIIQLSKESRAFAMRHFSSEIIVQKYIDLLNQ